MARPITCSQSFRRRRSSEIPPPLGPEERRLPTSRPACVGPRRHHPSLCRGYLVEGEKCRALYSTWKNLGLSWYHVSRPVSCTPRDHRFLALVPPKRHKPADREPILAAQPQHDKPLLMRFHLPAAEKILHREGTKSAGSATPRRLQRIAQRPVAGSCLWDIGTGRSLR